MTEYMKGLVKEEAAPGPFRWREDLPVPAPGPDEVLIRVHVAALCGTDLHIMEWDEWTRNWAKAPFIPGHEICGEIVALGSDVTQRKVGDRVSCESHIACHHCAACASGMEQICENLRLFGVSEDGGFAEYAKVRWDVTYVIEDPSIPDETAVLFEPMGAGVHGVEKAEVAGKNVLISGCGSIGLTAVAAAKTFGAQQVIVCDLIDEKLAIAEKMGADVTLNAGREDVAEAVRRLTGGRGADAAIDITGSQQAITAAVKALRSGGRFVGVGLPTREIHLDLANDVFYREVEVTGISGRLIWKTWDDFAKVMAGPYFRSEYVLGGKDPMRDIDRAVEAVRSGVPGKMLLYPDVPPAEV